MVFDKIGPLSEMLKSGEDWEFHIRSKRFKNWHFNIYLKGGSKGVARNCLAKSADSRSS
jgi:hypothetical protein